jgi:hypothetical protein
VKRSKIAEALREAKSFIRVLPHSQVKRGDLQRNTFICHALADTEAFGHITDLQYRMAKALIEKRLGDFSIVEDFLCRTIGYDTYEEAKRKDPLCIQEYRLRWLDALIAEYSKDA